MFRLVIAIACALTLSGCFSFFANPADLYRGYKQSLGYYVANDSVNTVCLLPKLRVALWEFERQFGRRIVMSSGYRDPWHNADVGGADGSYHMKCMAADFFIPGIAKRDLIAFARANPNVGGLGCYPNKIFIHIDIRDRPAGWRRPIEFSGC